MSVLGTLREAIQSFRDVTGSKLPEIVLEKREYGMLLNELEDYPTRVGLARQPFFEPPGYVEIDGTIVWSR